MARHPSSPLRRRDAAETREAILEAAQRRLVASGPEALRLQVIAADVGVSHPAILHHFGSREGLLEALALRGLAQLQDELVAALSGEPGEEAPDVEALLARISTVLGDRGHARLLAWLAWTGRDREAVEPSGEPALVEIARVVHRRRLARRAAADPPPPSEEDTRHMVVLVAVALLGDAILGDGVRESAGLGGDAAARERFRSWLARALGRLVATPDA